MASVEVFDATRCTLGEGPFWHPERGAFFWFDILNKTLHGPGGPWVFDAHVSAAGWINRDRILIASDRALFVFNLETGAEDEVCPMEADDPVTRSNDGRADPFGGFWIGTMGFNAEPGAGAIYRYYRGTLRKIVADVTIPNAICFAPDGRTAYYTDTKDARLMRQPLAPDDGWPDGPAEVLIDARGEDFGLDGAVVDAQGNIWNAQWGAGRVACYGPDGTLRDTISFPARQTSCPAFGGADLNELYCTSAAEGLGADDTYAHNGCTFRTVTPHRGQAEHRVIL